jgi:hypothetical protein
MPFEWPQSLLSSLSRLESISEKKKGKETIKHQTPRSFRVFSVTRDVERAGRKKKRHPCQRLQEL